MIERLLSKALEERFQQEDLSDCYLVDISIGPHERFSVFIDSDSNLPISRCQMISRYLERLIEENGWAGEKYVLEVSSPGLDRPLKLKRQFTKNIGRRLKIHVVAGDTVEGKLIGVEEEGLRLQGDKNTAVDILFKDIEKALVQASFK